MAWLSILVRAAFLKGLWVIPILVMGYIGWMVAQPTWNKEGLIIKGNKLSFCFSAPHLNKKPRGAIPIDWINIPLKTLPIRERLDG